MMGVELRGARTNPAACQAFMAVDGECLFIEWDKGAEQLLGYGRHEVIGKMPLEILLDYSELRRVADFFVAMMSGRQERQQLYRVYPVKPRFGTPQQGRWYHQQILGVNGEICGIAVLINTDFNLDHHRMWDSLARKTTQVENDIRSRANLVTEWRAEVEKRHATQPASNKWLTRLTQREYDIVLELIAGKRPKSIARDMEISYHTVRNHIKSMFQKLGVHSQEALVSLLRAGGAK